MARRKRGYSPDDDFYSVSERIKLNSRDSDFTKGNSKPKGGKHKPKVANSPAFVEPPSFPLQYNIEDMEGVLGPAIKTPRPKTAPVATNSPPMNVDDYGERLSSLMNPREVEPPNMTADQKVIYDYDRRKRAHPEYNDIHKTVGMQSPSLENSYLLGARDAEIYQETMNRINGIPNAPTPSGMAGGGAYPTQSGAEAAAEQARYNDWLETNQNRGPSYGTNSEEWKSNRQAGIDARRADVQARRGRMQVRERTGGLDIKKFAGMSEDEIMGMMDEIGFSSEQKRLFHNMNNQYTNMMEGSVGTATELRSNQGKYNRMKSEIAELQSTSISSNAALETMTGKYINPNSGDFYEMTSAETRAKYNEMKNTATESSAKLDNLSKERELLEQKIKNVKDPNRLLNNAKEEVEYYMDRRGEFLNSMGNDTGKVRTLMDRVEASKKGATANAVREGAEQNVKDMAKNNIDDMAKGGLKLGTIGKVAVGAAALYGIVQMLNSSRGQQENSTLYSPGGAMY